MRFSRLRLLAGLSVGLAVVCGCGGSGGAPSSGDALTQARAALNRLSSGEEPTNQQALQSILDLFQQALEQDPSNLEARFGAAVCQAGVVAQEVDGYTGNVAPISVPPTPAVNGSLSTTAAPQAPPEKSMVIDSVARDTGAAVPSPAGSPSLGVAQPAHIVGIFWNLDAGLSDPYGLLNMLAPIADLRGGIIPFYGYRSDDVAQRQRMLDGLNTVEQQLVAVEVDPSFSVTLNIGSPSVRSLMVGLPEVYLFDAYVNTLRANIALSLAYIRDPGPSWQPPLPPFAPAWQSAAGSLGGSAAPVAIQWTPASLDKDHDGKLTPSEYLPPSPFLTLRDAALLTTAQQAMLAVVDREQKGIDGVFARPAGSQFLIPNSAGIHASLAAVRNNLLPLIRQAANGSVTLNMPLWYGTPVHTPTAASGATSRDLFVPGGEPLGTSGPAFTPLPPQQQVIKFDLAAWFAHPPADLKAFAPTLTLGTDGWPDSLKTVYPDPTFGGLFPDGLKTDLPF